MKRFSALFEAIDQTTSTNAKVSALAAYFREAPPGDAAWAIFFLTGRRLKRVVPSAGLRQWAQEVTGLPEWLLHESYSAAGDFGELVALALDAVPPGPPEPDISLATWVEERLLPLQKADSATQREEVTRWWRALSRLERFHGVGRRRGAWWKWKIDPYTVDAVLIYAQPGNGRRASLLTDYTFGVWHETQLVPVAKAYSGLSNAEIEEMDKWIRRHTIERHGPVRAVEPVQVFELGFEAIAASSRHKSGIAVRFPRMLRWRKDKPASEADTLETLRSLIPAVS